MKDGNADRLADEYAAALQDYLSGAGEGALRRAYELGRSALSEGIGVLEVVAAYQRWLVRRGRGEDSASAPEQVRALRFLTESLSPFEMVLRGFQEANEKLRLRLEDVSRIRQELRSQHERLRASHQAVESERLRYREMFDWASDAFLVTDADGVIREANRAAAGLLRIARQSLTGRPLLELIAEDQRERAGRHIEQFRAARPGKQTRWHVEIKRGDGTTVLAAFTAGAELDNQGKLAGVLWMLREASSGLRSTGEAPRFPTGQAETEGAWRQELLVQAGTLLIGSLDYEASLEQVARLVVSCWAEGCFVHVMEPDGSVRQLAAACSEAAEGKLADETERQSLMARHTRARPLLCLHAQEAVIISEVIGGWLEEFADNPGQACALRRLNVRAAIAAPLAAGNQTLGLLTLLFARSSQRDEAADRELAVELARRCALTIASGRLYREAVEERDKAESAAWAQEKFLAILSHELRNPLIPVLGWARILKGQTAIMNDAVLSEGVQSLERNAQHLARLADDCLDLAGISQGRIQLEQALVDLNQVALASTEAVREVALAKRLDLLVELSPERLWILGDAARLRQVVMNLLVNAIKYTESPGHISVRSSRGEGGAELEVTDTGIGISPDLSEAIFEPFHQATGASLAPDSGLGLGLAISRQIVQLHRGRIWVESRGEDYGSRFRVRLPLAPVPSLLVLPELAPQPAQPAGQPVRVLLIEDARDVLLLLKLELEMEGYQVITAEDGMRGWDLAIRERPDLIISDFITPGINGCELMRQVRQDPELAGTPAIALTGLGMQTHREAALSAGFNACLVKPCETKELSALIHKLTKS